MGINDEKRPQCDSAQAILNSSASSYRGKMNKPNKIRTVRVTNIPPQKRITHNLAVQLTQSVSSNGTIPKSLKKSMRCGHR